MNTRGEEHTWGTIAVVIIILVFVAWALFFQGTSVQQAGKQVKTLITIDADQDGVLNADDVCAAAACNPALPQWRAPDGSSEQVPLQGARRGCTSRQDATSLDAQECKALPVIA